MIEWYTRVAASIFYLFLYDKHYSQCSLCAAVVWSLTRVQLFATPWTVARQAPLPSQEYRSGLPFPPPGDLPDPGIEPTSTALAGRVFITEPPSKQCVTLFNSLTVLAGRYYLSFTGEEMEANEIKATSCDRHGDVAPRGRVTLPTFREQRGQPSGISSFRVSQRRGACLAHKLALPRQHVPNFSTR